MNTPIGGSDMRYVLEAVEAMRKEASTSGLIESRAKLDMMDSIVGDLRISVKSGFRPTNATLRSALELIFERLARQSNVIYLRPRR